MLPDGRTYFWHRLVREVPLEPPGWRLPWWGEAAEEEEKEEEDEEGTPAAGLGLCAAAVPDASHDSRFFVVSTAPLYLAVTDSILFLA